jgi:hypothetical protein
MSRSSFHHRPHSEDDLGSLDFGSSVDGGSDRILDVVNQKEVEKSGNKGTVSINQMAHVFTLLQPDEENTITAESQRLNAYTERANSHGQKEDERRVQKSNDGCAHRCSLYVLSLLSC